MLAAHLQFVLRHCSRSLLALVGSFPPCKPSTHKLNERPAQPDSLPGRCGTHPARTQPCLSRTAPHARCRRRHRRGRAPQDRPAAAALPLPPRRSRRCRSSPGAPLLRESHAALRPLAGTAPAALVCLPATVRDCTAPALLRPRPLPPPAPSAGRGRRPGAAAPAGPRPAPPSRRCPPAARSCGPWLPALQERACGNEVGRSPEPDRWLGDARSDASDVLRDATAQPRWEWALGSALHHGGQVRHCSPLPLLPTITGAVQRDRSRRKIPPWCR